MWVAQLLRQADQLLQVLGMPLEVRRIARAVDRLEGCILPHKFAIEDIADLPIVDAVFAIPLTLPCGPLFGVARTAKLSFLDLPSHGGAKIMDT
jgi:hypothetical protein